MDRERDVERDIDRDFEGDLDHGYWYGGDHYYWDNDAWGLFAAGAVLTTGMVLTAATVDAMTCDMAPVAVNGTTYYTCGDNWYEKTYYGGDVSYVVVSPP